MAGRERLSTVVDGYGGSLLWFAVSLVVVVLVLWTLGIQDVLRALRAVDPDEVVGVISLAGIALLARGLGLYVVLTVLGQSVSAGRAVALYAASTFLNHVTPSGQAGGAPASGLLFARTGDASFETGMASILSINVLSNLVMFLLGSISIGYLVVTVAPAGRFDLVAAAAVGMLVLVALILMALWRFRPRLETASVSLITPVARGTARLLPRLSPPDRSTVKERVERFWQVLDDLRQASTGETLLTVGLLTGAHLLNVSALWLVFASLDESIAFTVLLAVVPTAALAAIAPVPGGTDIALIALLVATTGAESAIIGAAIVIYRVATHWFGMSLGGVVTAALVSFPEPNRPSG